MKNRLIATFRRIRSLMAWLWRALDAGRRIAANLLLLAVLVAGVVTVSTLVAMAGLPLALGLLGWLA